MVDLPSQDEMEDEDCEIAEDGDHRGREVLQQAGLQVDVLTVDSAFGRSDLTPYKAVVLGSAVYIGRWHKEAARFLKANEQTLAGKSVWLFSSGPTGEGDPVELLQGWRFPGKLQPIADRIQPRDIAVFHGALEKDELYREMDDQERQSACGRLS